MKLHNLCLDNLVEVPNQRFLEDIREGGRVAGARQQTA